MLSVHALATVNINFACKCDVHRIFIKGILTITSNQSEMRRMIAFLMYC